MQPGAALHEIPALVRRREPVMGTVVTIDVHIADESSDGDLSIRLARARSILHRADATFSTWKVNSPMSLVRRGELALKDAPQQIAEVLNTCARLRDMTDGWFDPWAMPGGVDPTGYVKGWAAQRALDALDGADVAGAIVNAAGDIASSGTCADGERFRVGIVDPGSTHKLLCVVELSGAIATSGTYERGAHLFDPHSCRPCARVTSASVCGPDLAVADALATALAVSGEEGLSFIESTVEYEAMIVRFDGSMRSTPQFPFAPPR